MPLVWVRSGRSGTSGGILWAIVLYGLRRTTMSKLEARLLPNVLAAITNAESGLQSAGVEGTQTPFATAQETMICA